MRSATLYSRPPHGPPRSSSFPSLLAIAAVSISGCYLAHPLDVDGFPDGGAQQDGAAQHDGGSVDGAPGWFDAGDAAPILFDAGRPDAAPPRFDAGDAAPILFDAGRDAGRLDGAPGWFDAGDAAPILFDAGRVDAGRVDAGPVPLDAGPVPLDAGPVPLDAGPVPLDAGPERRALRFSASTYFSVGDAPTFDIAGDSTFEVWVRSRERAGVDFCGKGNRLSRDLIVGQRAGRIVAGWQVAGVEYFLEGPETPFDRWVHVSIVRRSTADGTHAARLYVDGELVSTADSLPRLTSSFNDIEFRCGLSNADIDEVRLWRVARTGDDIRATFDRRVSGGIPGLMHYWRLDERGQILTDYTPLGRVGINGRLTTPDPADGIWITDGAI